MAETIKAILGPRVLIRRDREAAERNGIMIPEASRGELNTGTVVYAGISHVPSDVLKDPAVQLQLLCFAPKTLGSQYQAGDRVMFHPFEVLQVQVNNETLWLAADEAVVAMLGETA